MLIKPVCYDAFVFITHKDNPVDNLTIEEIQKSIPVKSLTGKK